MYSVLQLMYSIHVTKCIIYHHNNTQIYKLNAQVKTIYHPGTEMNK